jgi:hypothetical protein
MDDLKLAQELYEDAIEATRDQRTADRGRPAFSDPSNPSSGTRSQAQARARPGRRASLPGDGPHRPVRCQRRRPGHEEPALDPHRSGGLWLGRESVRADRRHLAPHRVRQPGADALRHGADLRCSHGRRLPDRASRVHRPRDGLSGAAHQLEADPLRVVFDPWSVQLDGSDADFGYKLTSLSEREFKRRYGDKAEKGELRAGRAQPGRDHNERKSIIIAEQWYKEEKTRNVIVYTGADGEETSGRRTSTTPPARRRPCSCPTCATTPTSTSA